MTKDVKKQLLVGLPSTGKTTFLAALWHVLESEEVQGSLRVERLSGDRDYLNSIRDEWLTCQRVSRTLPVVSAPIQLHLVDPATGARTDVTLPDLAGEVFREQWIRRAWDMEFAEVATGTSGVLLFLHPDQVHEPVTIGEAAAALGAFAGDVNVEDDAEEQPWRIEDAPTQVVLVDLLQFLARGIASPPLRLGVIISAWDLVTRRFQDQQPAQWLRERLPLLDQFLQANPEMFDVRCYGVSAQGGDLKTDVQTLLAHSTTSDRIVVQENGVESHDVTSPVRWLMES